MIGSHDTFTYLKSTSWLYNNCKKYWKCQCKSIEEQYAFGIRMFDIRIYRDKNLWKPCHGKANMKDMGWCSIKDIVYYMSVKFPMAIYRLWLEKGNDKDKQLFKSELMEALNDWVFTTGQSLLWRAGIKETKEWKYGLFNQNQKLYNMGYKFALNNTWESPCHELHGGINNIDDIFHTDLRKKARKINGGFDFFKDSNKLKKMLSSNNELYFLDFCTNEY